MARIACELSDQVILTSDNPRSEDPAEIIRQMERGIPPTDTENRSALPIAKKRLKQRSHWRGPEISSWSRARVMKSTRRSKGVRHPFDDKKVIEELFKSGN